MELAAGDEKPGIGKNASTAGMPVVLGIGSEMLLTLKVRDTETIEALSEHADADKRHAFALAALKVGVLALKQARGTVDAQAIRNEGEKLVLDLKHQVEGHSKLVESKVASILDSYFDPRNGSFSARVKGLVDKDGELSRVLEAQLSGEDSRLAKLLAKQVGESSPLVAKLDPRNKEGVISSIENAVAKLLDDQRKAVLGEFDLNNDKSAIKRLLSGVDEMNKGLASKFDLNDKNSALSNLRLLLDETKKEVGKQLNLNDKDSALATLERKLTEQVKAIAESQVKFQRELGEQVSAALGQILGRREEAVRGTAHGLEYEDEVADSITHIFQGAGDQVDHVGDKVGEIPRSKVGDVVVTLSDESACPGERIVVEAKQDKSFTRIKDGRAELEEACENRLAKVGVFVMSGRSVEEMEKEGTRHEWTRPLMRFGNHVLVVWHPEREHSASILDAAMSLAKALVVRASRETESADWDAINSAIHEIDRNVQRFSDLEKGCDKIDKATAEMRKQLEGIAENLKESAESLSAELDSLQGSEDQAE